MLQQYYAPPLYAGSLARPSIDGVPMTTTLQEIERRRRREVALRRNAELDAQTRAVRAEQQRADAVRLAVLEKQSAVVRSVVDASRSFEASLKDYEAVISNGPTNFLSARAHT